MIGWVGGLVGCVLGLAGALVGAYFSIKNTNGPRERAFMIKACVVTFVGVFIFLALLITLPSPYKWLMWIPYSILLPLGIRYGNKKQQLIRQHENV